jgi:hypothetical protein
VERAVVAPTRRVDFVGCRRGQIQNRITTVHAVVPGRCQWQARLHHNSYLPFR